ncbi:hypothetical protein [Chroococcidiopsis sp. CCMEE 29]|uniref:hypothetical protein n=1 Tax=Chroococcidiopsis sp. CCMEE 29 TaxID=155894 RepID=UPI0020212BBB|nr:hypothetical protein [Chroococcidiopsis sp. CCMEE 29]
MNRVEIMHLSHAQIPAYVENQVALGRDRVSILKEIAALRNDIVLLSVRDDESTFQQKLQAALKPSQQ